MKQYIINEDQKVIIMRAFGKVIADISFQPLLILNYLPEHKNSDELIKDLKRDIIETQDMDV